MTQMNPPQMPNDFALPAEPPSWPKVVGIISIVWGSLGVFCNACGLIGQAGGNFFVNMMPPEQQEQMKAQMAAGGSAMLAIYVLSALVAGMLIVAGVLTLQRKILGRTLHLVYGAVGTLLTIVGTAVSFGAIEAQMQAAGANIPPEQAAATKMGMYAGLVFGVCLGLAYPVFCLVWFMIKRTHKDMTGGFEQEPVV